MGSSEAIEINTWLSWAQNGAQQIVRSRWFEFTAGFVILLRPGGWINFICSMCGFRIQDFPNQLGILGRPSQTMRILILWEDVTSSSVFSRVFPRNLITIGIEAHLSVRNDTAFDSDFWPGGLLLQLAQVSS